MKEVTQRQIISFRPCGLRGEEDGWNYTPARIKHLMSGKPFVTPCEIHEHEQVSWKDKYWLLSFLLDDPGKWELAYRTVKSAALGDVESKRILARYKKDEGNASSKTAVVRAAGSALYLAIQIAVESGERVAVYSSTDRAADRELYWEKFCAIALEMVEQSHD